MPRCTFKLRDNNELASNELTVHAEQRGNFLELFLEGYGSPNPAFGGPVALEIYDGKPRLIVSKPGSDDDVDVIDLSLLKQEEVCSTSP